MRALAAAIDAVGQELAVGAERADLEGEVPLAFSAGRCFCLQRRTVKEQLLAPTRHVLAKVGLVLRAGSGPEVVLILADLIGFLEVELGLRAPLDLTKEGLAERSERRHRGIGVGVLALEILDDVGAEGSVSLGLVAKPEVVVLERLAVTGGRMRISRRYGAARPPERAPIATTIKTDWTTAQTAEFRIFTLLVESSSSRNNAMRKRARPRSGSS